MVEVERGDIPAAERQAGVRQAARAAARRVVHAVGEAGEGGAGPRRADHQVCHLQLRVRPGALR